MFGVFPGLYDKQTSVGSIVPRFEATKQQACTYVLENHIVGIRHAKSLGLGNQSGLSCSRQSSIVPGWDATLPSS